MHLTAPLMFVCSLLIAVPCVAQTQVVFPEISELGGYSFKPIEISGTVEASANMHTPRKIADLKTGDRVMIDLHEKPGAAYLRLFGEDVPNDAIGALLESRIIGVDNERVVAEYQMTISRDTDSARIVTVTSSFERRQLEGPARYLLPLPSNETKSIQGIRELLQRHQSLPRIQIDSFDQTRIRTWKLDTEIKE